MIKHVYELRLGDRIKYIHGLRPYEVFNLLTQFADEDTPDIFVVGLASEAARPADWDLGGHIKVTVGIPSDPGGRVGEHTFRALDLFELEDKPSPHAKH
jgi:hypothetical protein